MKVKSTPTKTPIQEFITFFIVALAGASVNFFSRKFIYREFLPFGLSVIPAYLTGMIVGFVLTKRFAFNAKDSGNTRREMVKFIIISLLALIATYITSVATLHILHFYLSDSPPLIRNSLETLAHITGMGSSFMINYFGQKLFAFKSTGFYDRLKQLTINN
ncbi:MAG: GtrA family protein [Bacteroidota bacterium]